ncbi:MAG: LemA family protein [Patescibacteria group bacterium]|jgi:LemA protein
MDLLSIILIVIIVLVVIIALYLILTYNGLIRFKNRTDEAWSDIDVQLKRRHDLIPNLVEAVKGYSKHESETFTKVTEARAEALNAGTIEEKAAAENVLSGALKSLFAVAESYPELKASQNFLQLQDELSDTENKIQASRRFYNGNVRDFNTKLQVFPTNFFGKMLGFKDYQFFQITDEKERQNVEVKF